MKERGNARFTARGYHHAAHYYSQAIARLRRDLPFHLLLCPGHEDRKHELAVLFSNRAECYLRLDGKELAFSDAKESVAYDGLWYRVRWGARGESGGKVEG